MDLRVTPRGTVFWRGTELRCALGRSGCVVDKHEGDGATPIGRWPLRRLFYRPDRLTPPLTGLEARPLAPHDGWCDEPGQDDYNRLIRLPHPARHEALWRTDGLYDLFVELGYNDQPPLSGRGSAIFLHVATSDYAPTEGCVALALPDLLRVVAACDASTSLLVHP